MTKKSLMGVIIAAFIFVALITVATFFDLEISMALGNADSVFGQFFNVFGMAIILLVVPTSGIIFYQALTTNIKYYVLLKVVFALLILVGFYFLVDDNMDRLGVEIAMQPLYVSVFAIILTIISILATNHIDKKIMEKLVIFAIFILVASIISELIIEFLKHAWARQRFRNMPEEDYSAFTQWYKPNWFGKNGYSQAVVPDFAGGSQDGIYRSFPSGHAGSAALAFMLVMLPELFDKLKKYKIWFWVFPILFTCATMLARIIARAHFLSDVVVGVYITLLVVFITKKLVYVFYDKWKNRIKKQVMTENTNNKVIIDNEKIINKQEITNNGDNTMINPKEDVKD